MVTATSKAAAIPSEIRIAMGVCESRAGVKTAHKRGGSIGFADRGGDESPPLLDAMRRTWYPIDE